MAGILPQAMTGIDWVDEDMLRELYAVCCTVDGL